MKITVDTGELEKLISKLNSASAREVLEEGMRDLANQGRDIAKMNTPVQSGDLRNGWFVSEVSALSAVISNPVKYAEYVEYGHSQEPGRFVPALGKRLVASWVPGQFFAMRSEEIIRQQQDEILKPTIERGLEELLNG